LLYEHHAVRVETNATTTIIVPIASLSVAPQLRLMEHGQVENTTTRSSSGWRDTSMTRRCQEAPGIVKSAVGAFRARMYCPVTPSTMKQSHSILLTSNDQPVLGAVSGSMTTPQVFINGRYIGGAEALELYLQG